MPEPGFKQMQEFFRQVEAGRITSANFQEFLKNPDKFSEINIINSPVFLNFTPDNATVNFHHLNNNFMSWFHGKTEEAKDVSIPRPHHDLRKASPDDEIINDLGGRDKVEANPATLAGIYGLLKLQPNGQPGVLLTNGYANIFYVHDANSVLRAVSVFWFGGGWDVFASSVEDPNRWGAGYRVFSCLFLLILKSLSF